MKVRAGSTYRFEAVLIDRQFSHLNGTLVKVVNLPGAPKANTMGHCHVEDPQTGAFIGLVSTRSLTRK